MHEKLNKLNLHKVSEPDDLHQRILKNPFEVMSSALTEIFNSSTKNEIIPEVWKKANITAILGTVR